MSAHAHMRRTLREQEREGGERKRGTFTHCHLRNEAASKAMVLPINNDPMAGVGCRGGENSRQRAACGGSGKWRRR